MICNAVRHKKQIRVEKNDEPVQIDLKKYCFKERENQEKESSMENLSAKELFEIVKYSDADKNEWNNLIDISKNGTFLLNRNYMDYHSDRFTDFSLLIYHKKKLVAVFPANVKDNAVYSHQGLTYGGLIYINKLSVIDILDVFECIILYYKNHDINTIIYKAIPYIYTAYPAQEDIYALFRNDAKWIGCNISSTILLEKKLKFVESRKAGIRKAINNDLKYFCSDNFEAFWKILHDNLDAKYGVKPVHTLNEILYLKGLFSENIKLYLIQKQNDILAGTVLYLNKQIVHVQYISANQEGKKLGALDLLFDYLINNEYKDYDYFDFGQSTEQMGYYLNNNLLFQKDGFGGRGVAYNIYELDLRRK
ncbi:MAG: GNAT family N-acetyltransferase [Candidatus Azobacteroides sp.]|nr:GNAT family N-acetyltransferase [Candidatus Azobacteroides sp.]